MKLWASCHRTLVVMLALLLIPVACTEQTRYKAEREALVREIERQVVETSQELGIDRLDPPIISALRTVPRHEFIPPTLRSYAYGNHPLPIGGGQTISQPYIVAIMTQLLGVQAGDRVYELGTGSGYQSAILAEMGLEVYSVEIVQELADQAAETLKRLGYGRVRVKAGDGYLGWPEAAPFAGILVTAAANQIPEPLISQLAVGGHLVMPVGPPEGIQRLVTLEKTSIGTLKLRDLLPVRFVPISGPNTGTAEAMR